MSEQKENAQSNLLGELESIKSLLTKEDWKHIPILSDTVQWEPFETKAEEFDDSLIPTLEELAHVIEDEQFRRPQAATAATEANPQPPLALPKEKPILPPSAPDPLSRAIAYGGTGTTRAPVRPMFTLSHEDLEQDTSQREEPSMGSLPGQGSLFDAHKSDPQTRAERIQNNASAGENPFLPRHIRERLHTQRTLMDEIRSSAARPADAPHHHEEPSPVEARPEPSESPEQKLPAELTQAIIDDLVALYLPRIERELRQRLKAELQRISPREA